MAVNLKPVVKWVIKCDSCSVPFEKMVAALRPQYRGTSFQLEPTLNFQI